MGIRSKGDAERFRALAKKTFFSNETSRSFSPPRRRPR